MKQLITILKSNHFVRIALGATTGIGFLILIFSTTNSRLPPTPSQISLSSPYPEITELSNDQRSSAIRYRTGALDSLPIYHKGFMTSVGIDTDIYIFIRKNDPSETVRFEIYGLSYANPSTDPTINPNVIAFHESYIHGLKLMRTEGLTPSRMVFLYSDTEYIRTTTHDWIDHLGLLN